MAWPLTAMTTYVANSLPAIKAADLNALQTFAGAVLTNTYSFKSVQVDGTGGAASTGTSGYVEALTLYATANRSSATAGAGQAVVVGNIWRDTIPIAYAHVDNTVGAAALVRGVNIAAGGIAWQANGRVRVTLTNGPNNQLLPIAIAHTATGIHCTVNTLSATSFDVYTFDAAGVLADGYDFFVVVFGT